MDEYEEISYEEIEDMFGYLLENGYIETVMLDKYGDPVYKMTPKMIRDFPQAFEEHMQFTNNLVFSVWQKGLLEMTMDEEKGWTIIPNQATKNYEDFEDILTDEEMLLLWEINNMMGDEV